MLSAEFILNWLQHFQFLSYLIMFGIGFFESLAFVGLLIPGTLLIVSIGILNADGILDPRITLLAITLGAVIGDLISFYIGKRSQQLFKPTGLAMTNRRLQQGELLFERYGEKAIFICRFIGPLRPITPFLAGVLSMPTKKFLFWDICGATISSGLFLALGFFLGQALPKKVLAHRMEEIFLLIIILIIIFYLSKIIIAKFNNKITDKLESVEQKIKNE